MDYNISPEKFAGFLWRMILTNKTTKKEIREEFGISKPTLDRWLSGENIPHPIFCAKIIGYFRYSYEN